MVRVRFYFVLILFALMLPMRYCLRFQLPGRDGATIGVPVDYATIQEGINAANDGDTVLVVAGTYYEHVVLNKSVSLVGENRGLTVIDGNGSDYVVSIEVDNVTVNGFTIRNGTTAGVFLANCSDCMIENNIITLNLKLCGIGLSYSSRNLICNNEIFRNGLAQPSLWFGDGVFLYLSCNNTISSNRIYDNVCFGIDLYGSDANLLYENDVINQSDGIVLLLSANNVVEANNASKSYSDGILIRESHYNKVLENEVFGNGFMTYVDYGIEINRSTNNTVASNRVHDNIGGIGVKDEAPDNTVAYNTIASNVVGVHVHYSNSSVFFKNNFIDNKLAQASVGDAYPDIDVWDSGAEGNYWSNFAGTDSNLDGIIDTPYVLDIRNQDNYPLAEPWSETRTHQANWDGTAYNVTTFCNSTVAGFSFSQPNKQIGFNITCPASSTSVCNVTIPLSLMWGYFSLLVDDVPQAYAIYQNTTHTSIYFTIPFQSTKQIKILSTGIVPENHSLALTLIMLITTAAICSKTRLQLRKNTKKRDS